MKRLISKRFIVAEILKQDSNGNFYKNPTMNEISGTNYKFLYLPSTDEFFVGPDNAPDETLKDIAEYDDNYESYSMENSIGNPLDEAPNWMNEDSKYYHYWARDIRPSHSDITQTVVEQPNNDHYLDAECLFGIVFQNVIYVEDSSENVAKFSNYLIKMGYDENTSISTHGMDLIMTLREAADGKFQWDYYVSRKIR